MPSPGQANHRAGGGGTCTRFPRRLRAAGFARFTSVAIDHQAFILSPGRPRPEPDRPGLPVSGSPASPAVLPSMVFGARCPPTPCPGWQLPFQGYCPIYLYPLVKEQPIGYFSPPPPFCQVSVAFIIRFI